LERRDAASAGSTAPGSFPESMGRRPTVLVQFTDNKAGCLSLAPEQEQCRREYGPEQQLQHAARSTHKMGLPGAKVGRALLQPPALEARARVL
jgi:hypothetical protein